MRIIILKRLSLVLLALTMYLGTCIAEGLTDYYSSPASGSFYLYNVNQAQYLMRLSNNYPGLSTTPAEVILAPSEDGYTIRFSDGKYLKTGFWNDQYLWTDGATGATEGVWTFSPIEGGDKVYQLHRTAEDTWNSVTGIYYVNGTNAATEPTEECCWALIDVEAYCDYKKANMSIPASYLAAPATGSYYLYNVVEDAFYSYSGGNGSAMDEEPAMLFSLTEQSDGSFTIKNDTRYLKLGFYKDQYLWTDGTESNLAYWNLEEEAAGSKTYIISSDNFLDGAVQLRDASGKPYTWYFTGRSVSKDRPVTGVWALITEEDYLAYLSSGAGAVDVTIVAANKQAMVAAKGDATSLVKNPSLTSSAEGWWGGTRTLTQLYRGSGYTYETDVDGGTLLQTIKHMPAGTYKVVAAVRGSAGTTSTARVADQAGNAVENKGYALEGNQLNLNGVMMPYSTLGGFSYNENAQGWNWLTAEGELDEDGNLKIEFVLNGTGTMAITDVHLYYMGDGEHTYAVEYTDGVDAAGHAVTCDLTADSPNRLFVANATITTITGAKLQNNLVNGTVSELVLWDGHDFAPAEDFIATKGSYYRHIAEGSLETLCVPFAVTTGATGTCYVPHSVEGHTLNLKTVKKMEAGKPYLYQATDEVIVLKGSGIVKATPVNAGTASSLVGVYTRSAVEEGYIPEGHELRRVAGTAVDAFDAYFLIESTAKNIALNFDYDPSTIWKNPVLVTTDFAVGQECYLYNVGAGRFYTEGNAYGTQGSLMATGLRCKFIANGNNVVLTNYSVAKNGWYKAFVTTNGALFVDGVDVTEYHWQVVPGKDNTFRLMPASPNTVYNQKNYPGAMFGLDLFENAARTNLSCLLMYAEEPGEGLYLTDWAVATPAEYDKYQLEVATYKAATELKELLDEAEQMGKDIADELAIYENVGSTLEQLEDAIDSVTNKLLEDELSDASKDNPIDVTAKFITNHTYENNDNEGWPETVVPGMNVAANLQNAEFFNCNFDYYQDLRGLPDGYYRLSLQGFYRAGLEGPALEAKQNDTEASVMNAELYAVTDGQTSVTKIQSIFSGAPSAPLNTEGEISLGEWYVPNTMNAAAAYFAAGYYTGNSILVQVTDGQLRIGLRKSTTIRRDWVMFDNWQLLYYGNENPEE